MTAPTDDAGRVVLSDPERVALYDASGNLPWTEGVVRRLLTDRLAAETARADTAEDALWRVRARVLTIVGGLEHGYWDAGRGVAARIRAALDGAPQDHP